MGAINHNLTDTLRRDAAGVVCKHGLGAVEGAKAPVEDIVVLKHVTWGYVPSVVRIEDS